MANITNTIDELKEQLDIVDVISRVVPLKKAGVNYKGVCPFHNEKTPSFIVSEQKQIFTCFGCGATGDLIEFTKRFYNLEFQEAIEKLATDNGITIDLHKSETGKERDKYYEFNKEAGRYFYNAFSSSKNPAYTYMNKRGLSDITLKKFGIGYADSNWTSLLEYFKDKTDEKTLVDLGFIVKKDNKTYDKFRDRVIFPIINTSGKIVGFTGRTLTDASPKYLNSPENLIFQKKNNLFGINLAKQDIGRKGYSILVEGNVDVMSLYQAGFTNVVASCGTALTENQARLLKKYAKTVILCYDSDDAGIAASLRGIDILTAEGLNVKVMHVTDGKDPDDFINKHGKDAFSKLVEDALPAIDYKLLRAKDKLDLGKDLDKIEYINRAKRILSNITPTTADIYIKKLSKELNISESAFQLELESKPNNEAINFENRISKKEENDNSIYLNNIEKNLIKILFINSEFIEKVIPYEQIFNTPFSIKIRNIMYELYGEKGKFEEVNIIDRLEIEESNYITNNVDTIIINGNEEQVFDEVIKKWKLNILESREKQLIEMLSLSSDDDHEEAILKINKQLIEIQNKIKEIKREK